MSRRDGVVVDAFDVAGVVCGIECEAGGFRRTVASRYAEFASHRAPELSLRVEIREPLAEEALARWSGPFARIGGTDGVLSIEGVGFSGTFDERSGRGWIAQPPIPTPLETFLTAICAGRLLRRGSFFLHAAAIVRAGRAHVFFGPSGSGKTTVAGLVGEGVISDEVAAIRRDGDGYVVSGVPWRGQRLSAPLAALFHLRKAPESARTRLAPADAVRRLLPSVFFPRPDFPEVGPFLEIAGKLVKRVACYEMRFAPDRSFLDSLPGEGETPWSRTMSG